MFLWISAFLTLVSPFGGFSMKEPQDNFSPLWLSIFPFLALVFLPLLRPNLQRLLFRSLITVRWVPMSTIYLWGGINREEYRLLSLDSCSYQCKWFKISLLLSFLSGDFSRLLSHLTAQIFLSSSVELLTVSDLKLSLSLELPGIIYIYSLSGPHFSFSDLVTLYQILPYLPKWGGGGEGAFDFSQLGDTVTTAIWLLQKISCCDGSDSLSNFLKFKWKQKYLASTLF